MSEDRSEPARISRAYLRFAEVKARGRSSLYETLARGVAADPEIIAFLAALPKEKRSRTSCWLPCVTVAVRRAAGMTAVPQIVWWAGLDLNPLDVSDPEQAAWLRTLVWPEQTDRLARLCAAMKSQRRASLASTLVICGMIWRPWQRRRQNPRRSSSFIPPYLPMLQRPPSAPNSPDRSGRDAIFGWRTRRRTSFPKLPHASAKQGCGAGSSCR